MAARKKELSKSCLCMDFLKIRNARAGGEKPGDINIL